MMSGMWDLNERDGGGSGDRDGNRDNVMFGIGSVFDNVTNEQTRAYVGGGSNLAHTSHTTRSNDDYSYIRNSLSDKASISKSLNEDITNIKKLRYPSLKHRILDYNYFHTKFSNDKYKSTQCSIYSNKKVEELYEVLGFGHHGIAYKIEIGKKQLVVKRAFINKLKQYSISQNMDVNIPEFNEILHMEKINKIITANMSPNFPYLYNYTWCNNSDSLLLFMEYFDMTLLTFYLRERSSELHYNILFQLLAAVNIMQTVLKMVHNDLTLTNIMVKKVRPGGHWIFYIGKTKYYIPNLGYIVIILDFGMAESEDVLNNIIITSSSGVYGEKDRIDRFRKNLHSNYNLKLLFNVLHSHLKIEYLKQHMTVADYKKSKILSNDVITIIKTAAQQKYKHILYKSMPFIRNKISQQKIIEKLYASYVIADGKFNMIKKYIINKKDTDTASTKKFLVHLPPPDVEKLIDTIYKQLYTHGAVTTTGTTITILKKYFSHYLKPIDSPLLDTFK
jgi:serine/threonine protein kinase